MVAKVAGGIIGLGLIGTGSVAMAKPEWFGINREIAWKPLSQDSDYKTKSSEYSSKFGETYKYYLVGTTENQDWWNKIFDQLKEDNNKTSDGPSDKFKHKDNDKKVTKGFDNSNSPDGKALNQICKKIYKETATNIKQTVSNSDTDYKESDVWKYCSGLGQKPTAVQSNHVGTTYDNNNIGKKKEEKLVSVTDPKNDKFWEIRDKEFNNKEGYGPIEANSTDAFFKTDLGKTIKQLCEKAYKQDPASSSSTTEAPTEDQAVKYCSLDKK